MKSLQLNHALIDAHINLGNIYKHIGDLNNAILSYKSASYLAEKLLARTNKYFVQY